MWFRKCGFPLSQGALRVTRFPRNDNANDWPSSENIGQPILVNMVETFLTQTPKYLPPNIQSTGTVEYTNKAALKQ